MPKRIWAWDDTHDPGWQDTPPTAFDDFTEYVHIDEYNRVAKALDQAIAPDDDDYTSWNMGFLKEHCPELHDYIKGSE